MAYRLLAGRDVFEGENVMQLIYQHLAEVPTPLSELAAETPPELTAIVMRCLAKDPEDRWPSADELLDALRETGLGEGWTHERARTWWERNQPTAAVDGAAATVPAAALSPTMPADMESGPTLPADGSERAS